VIEAYASALDRSWPIQEALEQLREIAPLRSIPDEEARVTDINPEIVLVVLAGRYYCAGRESMGNG
jgi:hypothetical protein